MSDKHLRLHVWLCLGPVHTKRRGSKWCHLRWRRHRPFDAGHGRGTCALVVYTPTPTEFSTRSELARSYSELPRAVLPAVPKAHKALPGQWRATQCKQPKLAVSNERSGAPRAWLTAVNSASRARPGGWRARRFGKAVWPPRQWAPWHQRHRYGTRHGAIVARLPRRAPQWRLIQRHTGRSRVIAPCSPMQVARALRSSGPVPSVQRSFRQHNLQSRNISRLAGFGFLSNLFGGSTTKREVRA